MSTIAAFISEYGIQAVLLLIAIFAIHKFYGDSKRKRFPPGPIGLPFVGYLPFLKEESYKSLSELAQKYGNIFSLRMGMNLTVVFNDYETAKEAISHQSALDRAPEMFEHIGDLGFQTLNGDAWTEQRRFSVQSMRNLGLGRSAWEGIVMEEVTEFLNLLRSFKGKPVDIAGQLNDVISSNIMSLLIGRRMQKGAEDGKIQLLHEFADVAFATLGPSFFTSLVPGLRTFCQLFGLAAHDKAADIVSKVDNLVKEEIGKHKSQSEYKGITDFINLYLDELENVKNKGTSFSDRNLKGNMKILFLGASDTITSSLKWLFRLLADHQDIQKKVQKELDEVIGRDGRAYYEERAKIPYTFAVLMETQRMASIVPISTTRVATQDFEIQGYHITKGTEIVSNLWALHNDEKYWPEPEKFIPERFLRDGNQLLQNPPSYGPFSFGRRMCPGSTVAWMEILVFLTSVLQKFTITLPPGMKANYNVIQGLVTHLKPQPLCFTERLPDN